MDNEIKQEQEVYQRRMQEMGAAIGQTVYGGVDCARPRPFDMTGMGQTVPPRGRGVSLRKATVLRIGCQEIVLAEDGSRIEVRSAMGCTSLSKQDLAVIIAELTRLRSVLVEEGGREK